MNKQTQIDFDRGDMTFDETLVWAALQEFIGKSHAATQYDLADACKMEERKVRTVIKDLIFKHRKAIASSPDRIKGGYFIIATKEEAQEAALRYQRQAVAIIQRGAILLKTTDSVMLRKIQMEIDL